MTRFSVGQAVSKNLRKYNRESSVVFFKTKEQFGGLSNMAGGYPLQVNGIDIRSSEALYQACRFPHRSDLQSLVIEQKSPMTAKMKTKPYRNLTRSDWNQVRVDIMRWCLRVKLAQNWHKFSNLLIETDDRPIVEQSRKDDFWGAIPNTDNQTLVGCNALGRLLMELREAVTNSWPPDDFLIVESLEIPDFKLDNRTIERVEGRALLAPETVGDVQKPMVEVHDESSKQLGFNLKEPASGPVHQVQERTESNLYGQVRSEIGTYPEYRDSGLEWLGKVPAHWEVLPNRALFKEVKECEHPEEPLLSVTIKEGVIHQRDLLAGSAKKDSSNQDKSAYKLVRPGDIAYNKMRAWQGAIGTSDYQGIVSPAYIVERPREGINSRYLHYLLRTPAFAKEAERWSYGITSDMWSLRPEHFKMIYGCLPPLSEQISIVRFLDHADRRVQRYIRAKQKFLSLLKEQKQAIILEAVTGQIDVRTGKPYLAYKQSGVEWLGDVPEHWEVCKLGQIGRFLKGNGGNREDEVSAGTPCVRYGDLYTTHKYFILQSRSYISEQKAVDYTPIRFGDVLFAGSGETIEEIGKSAVSLLHSDAVCGGDVIILRPSRQFDAEFIGYVMDCRPVATQKALMGRGITVMHIYISNLKNVTVSLPPLSEQKAIGRYLGSINIALDSAISNGQQEIELLKEYHSRLIADVVTGKVDVRKVAEMPGEVEQLDESDDVTGNTNAPGWT